jgi:hypothetical protein
MNKEVLFSYARVFLASSLAVFAAGVTEPKAIAYAGIISVLPPLLRWLNPNDKTFGKGAQDE